MVTISRGDVVLCDLNPVVGTEQAGVRPAVILQTEVRNKKWLLHLGIFRGRLTHEI